MARKDRDGVRRQGRRHPGAAAGHRREVRRREGGMTYTVFVRSNDDDYGGLADKASVPCRLRGRPAFIGCCFGDVEVEDALAVVVTDEPAVVARELVELISPSEP